MPRERLLDECESGGHAWSKSFSQMVYHHCRRQSLEPRLKSRRTVISTAPWSPDGFGSIAPQNKRANSPRACREVRNSRIMSNECNARCQPFRQFREWSALHQLDASRRQKGSQSLESSSFRFATSEQQVQRRGLDNVLKKLQPFRFRPVSCFRCPLPGCTASQRPVLILVSKALATLSCGTAFPHRISPIRSRGFKKTLGGMKVLTIVRPVRPGDELPLSTERDVRFENFIGIVKVRDDQIELREIIDQVFREIAVPRKKLANARASMDCTLLTNPPATAS